MNTHRRWVRAFLLFSCHGAVSLRRERTNTTQIWCIVPLLKSRLHKDNTMIIEQDRQKARKLLAFKCQHSAGSSIAVCRSCTEPMLWREIAATREAEAALDEEMKGNEGRCGCWFTDGKWTTKCLAHSTIEKDRDEAHRKLADATRFCSGEFPCEASTMAASLEVQLSEARGERDDAKAVCEEACGSRNLRETAFARVLILRQALEQVNTTKSHFSCGCRKLEHVQVIADKALAATPNTAQVVEDIRLLLMIETDGVRADLAIAAADRLRKQFSKPEKPKEDSCPKED